MVNPAVEEWRPVPEFEELYEISNLGRVASLPKPTWGGRRILSAANHARGGYLFVTLHRPGRNFHRKVHHLVCTAFNGARPPGMLARHVDGNPLNNVPENLAWGTASENGFDCVRHGRHHNAEKTRCKSGHPLDGENLYINPASGARQCRTCRRAYRAAYARRKGAGQ